MRCTLTNLGAEALPITSSQGAGFATLLPPGQSYIVNDPHLTVLTAGDNPSFAEDFKDAVSGIAQTILAVLEFWKDRPQPKEGEEASAVKLQIDAQDPIRVTSDDKTMDYEVVPGETYTASSPNYVELRQLGV